MFLLVYVDDIIVASSSQEVVATVLEDLRADFALKDLGPLHYFLGIEVKQNSDGLHLSQSKYAADILKRARMTHCKPVTTPLAASDKLSIHIGKPLSVEESTKYRSIVDDLKYVMLTRPDIAYSVNKVCRFLHAPTTEHLTVVKRILRYLKYTIDTGLRFVRSGSMLVSAFRTQIGPKIVMTGGQQVVSPSN
jgi:hypothetical protein